MRKVDVKEIQQAIAEMCMSANLFLPPDLKKRLGEVRKSESSTLCSNVLCELERNYQTAEEQRIPVCQDTGMTVVFAEIGQEVYLVGGDFEQAVNQGVAQGYREGYLRCSVVGDPLRRINTGDNTPAIIHTRIVPGDKVKLTVAPKGFGSENMSAVRMFTPSATEEDIIAFVAQTALLAGSNPCPPVVIGVGIGGDFERCAQLAKLALCRAVDTPNQEEYYANLEKRMLDAVNGTGVGAQGFGGDITALAVNIEWFPTHIAGLPVAVNMGCHATRHQTFII